MTAEGVATGEGIPFLADDLSGPSRLHPGGASLI
jgi:hypothetical protein